MNEELKTEAKIGELPETGMKDESLAKDTKDKAAAAPRAAKKQKIVRQVSHGRAYIKASYNNTIVTLTDQNGNVLVWCSAGKAGFKGPKKATPYAAGIIVKDAADRVKEYGLVDVNVFVKGVGAGREAAVRALNANGINVLTIKDITPIPHGGCRAPRARRI